MVRGHDLDCVEFPREGAPVNSINAAGEQEPHGLSNFSPEEWTAENIDEIAPVTRGDCIHGIRPCPFIRCKWHTFWWWLETALRKKSGGHTKTWKQLTKWVPGMVGTENDAVTDELLDMVLTEHSCILDIIDEGHDSLEEIGDIFGISRERVRQIEGKKIMHGRMSGTHHTFRRLRHYVRKQLLKDWVEEIELNSKRFKKDRHFAGQEQSWYMDFPTKEECSRHFRETNKKSQVVKE